MIPALENAEFARLGGLHRNTYLNSPKLLDPYLRLKSMPRLRFAGQITGCEGYVESAAIGLMAGRFTACDVLGKAPHAPPPTTAMGALLGHITGGHIDASDTEENDTFDAASVVVEEVVKTQKLRSFQPMNINFGLFPLLECVPKGEDGKRLRGPEKSVAKKKAMTDRAKAALLAYQLTL